MMRIECYELTYKVFNEGRDNPFDPYYIKVRECFATEEEANKAKIEYMTNHKGWETNKYADRYCVEENYTVEKTVKVF